MFTKISDIKAFADLRIEANGLRLIDRSYEQENGRVILSCLLEADETSRVSVDGLHCDFLSEKTRFIRISFHRDGAGACGIWHPDSGLQKNLRSDWAEEWFANLSHSAPVLSVFDAKDGNLFTYACSEVSADNRILAGVHEETGEIIVRDVVVLPEGWDGGTYRLQLYLDERAVPFSEALKEVSRWWDGLLPDPPAPVPETARLPMYSTWYSFHQDLDEAALEAEYELAAQMGMKAVIIDDGWQTSDVNRGYGFCGDWEVSPDKFADFAGHIRRIHELEMKCLLWHSVPFVGRYSRCWDRFRGRLLHYDPAACCGTLDPRYPEVREYLIDVFAGSVRKWNLDGLKLDFIDSFRTYEDTPAAGPGMDYTDIQAAVYVLMREVYQTISGITAGEPLIEFRQTYVGPQMRRFGNIFRVMDCPMSGVSNRVGTADLRLLGGNTAVHSDMLMWHASEKAEDVAIQMLCSIFADFQISVRLSLLPPEVRKTVEHYLAFSVRYRRVLQEGNFRAVSPLAGYPVLQAADDSVCITARYDRNVLLSQEDAAAADEWWILNGCRGTYAAVRITAAAEYQVTAFDCMGNCVCRDARRLEEGAAIFSVPAGGSVCLCMVGQRNPA